MGARRRKLEEQLFEKLSTGLIERLARYGVKPMTITLLAFISALASACFYYFAAENPSYYFLAAVLLTFSGFLDAIDGAVARRLKLTSELGAFLDSVFDKLGESAIYIAIMASGAVSVLWGSLALASSLMVSYVRHRAEPFRISLKGVGFMERAERMILLITASVLAPFIESALEIAMILISVFALITVIWRMLYIAQMLRK